MTKGWSLPGCLAAALALAPSVSLAESRWCYWDVEGLPYSAAPPPDAPEDRAEVGPQTTTYAFYLNNPGVVAKWLCGVVGSEDLVEARAWYQRNGCTEASSLGRMIEGIGEGRAPIFPGASGLKLMFEHNEPRLSRACAVVAEVSASCIHVIGVSGDDFEGYWREILKRRPDCIPGYLPLRSVADDVVAVFLEMHRDPEVQALFRRERELFRAPGGE